MKTAWIDLHLHLDGSITVPIARKLADLQNMALPMSDKELKKFLTVPDGCEDLNEFLSCFALPVSLMQTFDGLSEAAYLVAEELRAQGLLYAELRYAPQLHTEKGMTQEDAINAVLDGIRRSSLHANVILCCMRGIGNEAANEETVELAKKYLVEDGGVVGVDLAGAEALFPTKNYRTLFEKVSSYGIPFTLHAGEADGAQSVRLAIEYGASRIGHGVRANEDEAVLQSLIDKGIFLEMCPTSNRQTKAVPDMRDYPFPEYLGKGVKVTLNTDDPAIEGTTLENEFNYMEKAFGLTAAQEKILLANAVDAAFTTEKVKASLRKTIGL